LGLSGRVPRRVEAATKLALLELIDRAVADGWDHRRVCVYLELAEGRAWRWRERRLAGTLEDRSPGGHPVHAITPAEEQAILAVFEAHQDTDRSHRKLAHRGSYEGVVWVSESTVRRVLAKHQLRVRLSRRAGRSERQPFPDWASYERHSIWIYDTERHEVLWSRAVVRDHRGGPVAAGSRKLGAAYPSRRTGMAASSSDNDGTGQHCQMAWVRQARREGVREKPAPERSSRASTSSNLADLGWAAARIRASARRTPGPVSVVGREATVKVCGVAVAMLQGHSWTPNPTSGSRVNVGTIPAAPHRPARRWPAGRSVVG
jgi:hypothetical protein